MFQIIRNFQQEGIELRNHSTIDTDKIMFAEEQTYI